MPEDRGWHLCEKGVRQEWEETKTIGTDVGADTSAVGRRTDEIIAGVFLRSALTSGTAQLHEESTKVLKRKQLTSSSKEVGDVSVGSMDLEQKDWWQRKHDTGESRPRSITEYLFYSLTTCNFPRQLYSQLPTSHLSLVTRTRES